MSRARDTESDGNTHIASMMYDAPMAMAVTRLGQQQERADGAHQGGDDRKMPAADRHQMQYARTLEGVFKQIGVCGINTRARLAIATIWRNVILPKNT